MKKLDIINKLVEKLPRKKIENFLYNSSAYNLALLCSIDKEYLTEDNLKYIINFDNSAKNENKNANQLKVKKDFYTPIALIIITYPELFNKIPKEIISNFKVKDWVAIIQNYPQSIKDCQIIDKFNEFDWIKILTKYPNLSSYYKKMYEEFSFYNVGEILKNNKEFLNYIDLKKIKTDLTFGSTTIFHIYGLSEVLKVYPEAINIIDKNKITIHDWLNILKDNPNLINICPKVKEFTIDDKIELVSDQIQFKYMLTSVIDAIKINYAARTSSLLKLVIKQPQLIDELKINLKIFNAYDWASILEEHPNLIDKCDKINEFNIVNWIGILIKHPKLFNYCNKINEFDVEDLDYLLSRKPELINKYDVNVNLSGKTILKLAKKYPDFIEKINNNNTTEIDFQHALYSSKQNHVRFMQKYAKLFKNSTTITNMLGLYPDLKDLYTKNDLWKYVDFNKLNGFNEYSILK